MNKYKMFSILIVSFCINCGSDCDFRAGGLCVITNDLEVEEKEIIQIVEITQEELDNYYKKTPDLQQMLKDDGATAEFINYDAHLNCKKVKGDHGVYQCDDIYGVIYDNTHMVIEWRKCLGRTALAHEILHNFEHNVLWVDDKSPHQPPLFYGNAENPMDTIEIKIDIRTIRELDSCSYYW